MNGPCCVRITSDDMPPPGAQDFLRTMSDRGVPHDYVLPPLSLKATYHANRKGGHDTDESIHSLDIEVGDLNLTVTQSQVGCPPPSAPFFPPSSLPVRLRHAPPACGGLSRFPRGSFTRC